MPVKVTDKDRGWRKAIADAQRATRATVADPVVVVGVRQEKGLRSYPNGANVLEVATFNEFGTGQIPARSFIRDTVDLAHTQIQELVRKLAGLVFIGQTPARKALDFLGAFVHGKVIQRINAGVPPPNRPSTVERKGSSTPLVDKGQLKGSIDWEVRGA